MNFNEFEEIFRDSEMRAWLSWESLRQADVGVREIYSRSREVLAHFSTVWYTTPDGQNGDWRNASDRPLRVGEATQTFDNWPTGRAARVEDFRAQFKKSEYPIQLTLPAYAPNDRDIIILDGTHRTVAAYLTQKEVRLIVFALQGPCDAAVLPDLAHYSA